jgi:ketosteroid isomerase-like protein
MPSKGKETLKQYYAGKSDTSFILEWEPLYGDISVSGELGYTYGTWKRTEKTTKQISRGTYITIWKKQPDGSWKFVLDAGTQGLPDLTDQQQ